MCDYSLQHVASAPAKVGDRLVTTEFRHSGTRGFTEIGAPDVAICLRPGSELAFDGEVAFADPTGLLPRRARSPRASRDSARSISNNPTPITTRSNSPTGGWSC
jgi:hypothetical protein